jgi:hypothetical protein
MSHTSDFLTITGKDRAAPLFHFVLAPQSPTISTCIASDQHYLLVFATTTTCFDQRHRTVRHDTQPVMDGTGPGSSPQQQLRDHGDSSGLSRSASPGGNRKHRPFLGGRAPRLGTGRLSCSPLEVQRHLSENLQIIRRHVFHPDFGRFHGCQPPTTPRYSNAQ